MIDNGHGIGKDIVEPSNRFRREDFDPFASFRLHADENRLADHAIDKFFSREVVCYGETYPTIGGCTVAGTSFADRAKRKSSTVRPPRT